MFPEKNISKIITLITLLRVPYLCHFGSTSFVLPIRPKYGTLNRVIRVICHLNSHFVVKHLFKITENKTRTKNQQSFDGVEGLGYYLFLSFGLKRLMSVFCKNGHEPLYFGYDILSCQGASKELNFLLISVLKNQSKHCFLIIQN